MLVVSAVPAGAGQGVVCLQVLSLSPFHTEMGEMFSVLSLCFAAVVAAGQARAGQEQLWAQAGTLLWGRTGTQEAPGGFRRLRRLQGEQESSPGPGKAALSGGCWCRGALSTPREGKGEWTGLRQYRDKATVVAEELGSWMQHMVI